MSIELAIDVLNVCTHRIDGDDVIAIIKSTEVLIGKNE